MASTRDPRPGALGLLTVNVAADAAPATRQANTMDTRNALNIDTPSKWGGDYGRGRKIQRLPRPDCAIRHALQKDGDDAHDRRRERAVHSGSRPRAVQMRVQRLA